jgi:hypothetical protein
VNWSWWALPSLVTLVVAWLGAAAVLRTRADRPVNRRLALVLALEGLFIGCSSGFIFLVGSPTTAFALGVVATATMLAIVPQYLSFLAASLDTPLVRPFRGRHTVLLLNLLSVAAALLVAVFAAAFVTEPYSPAWAAWNYQLAYWGQRASQVHGLVAIFGLVAAVSAYYRTPRGSLRRTRALWFAVAFGVRDLYAGVFQILYPFVRPVEFWGDFVYNPGLGGVYLLYVALLTYAVLQAQLFDINLRVKFALRQSTVAAVITGAFFIGSELLEQVIPVDDLLLGVITAAICVLALRPIRKLAQRFADRVMHQVEDTPRYRDARKAEVYRTALEGILDDDIVTERERRILQRLREKLGIPEDEAERMEAEVTARMRPRRASRDGVAAH